MEISTTAPTTLTIPTNPKSPEADQIQPIKSLPFTNGVLKRHAPPLLPHAPPILYKECLKNHAASIGGHALDGCGEFMPSPSSISSDPTSLKCAACNCHRNFHRREIDHQIPMIEYNPNNRHHPPPPPSQSPPPISSSYYPSSAPHMLLALSGGATLSSGGSGRKRFRSKFTQIQKEKMLEFAEKLGWKMQKASEEMVAGFCSEVGVERGVFKVWMHNNKNTFGKRDLNGDANAGAGAGATVPVAGTFAGANNGSSGSHGYSKNGDATYGSSTSS